ncbi:BON domain-containing protein [Noviherbaspirillum massiliense]|uniref:BON domain-containing protein n=1 Tax=Noviherbaspirillum massiliense TaxID=1465823 RepID=UPI0002EE5794|nr:BON domain-containing protein [Noviherbaspirillum massiliense]
MPLFDASKTLLVAGAFSLTCTGCGRASAPEPAGPEEASSSSGTAESRASGAPGAPAEGVAVDDGVLAARVKTALLADSDIKGRDIRVETRKGEVVLSGTVGDQAQIDRALSIANSIEGVKRVTNRMIVKA